MASCPKSPLEVASANSVSTERADFSASRGFKTRFQAKLNWSVLSMGAWEWIKKGNCHLLGCSEKATQPGYLS